MYNLCLPRVAGSTYGEVEGVLQPNVFLVVWPLSPSLGACLWLIASFESMSAWAVFGSPSAPIAGHGCLRSQHCQVRLCLGCEAPELCAHDLVTLCQFWHLTTQSWMGSIDLKLLYSILSIKFVLFLRECLFRLKSPMNLG